MKFQNTFILYGANNCHKSAINTGLRTISSRMRHVMLGEQSISPRSLGLLEPEDECTTILRNPESYSLDTSRPRRRGSSHNLRLQRRSSSRNVLLKPQVGEAVGRRGKEEGN